MTLNFLTKVQLPSCVFQWYEVTLALLASPALSCIHLEKGGKNNELGILRFVLLFCFSHLSFLRSLLYGVVLFRKGI